MNFEWILNLLRRLRGKELEAPDEDPKPDPPLPETPEDEPELEMPGILHVGAWCGLSTINNPKRDVAFAVAHGIDRLDIIVNDHSKARSPRDFTAYSSERIQKLCAHAQAHGIETHLMSWIMPHVGYIEQAAELLVPLASECGAASLQWDAEEPWTQAKRPLPYAMAAKRIADTFKDLSCPMGVNGIGYTPAKKVGPLAEVCDYLVPQCYSTSSSGLRPETVVPKFVRRWKRLFADGRDFKPPGTKDKRLIVGLAAYRQRSIRGHTTETAMRTALAGAQALEGVDTVIYWSLRHIRKNKRVARVVRSIRRL